MSNHTMKLMGAKYHMERAIEACAVAYWIEAHGLDISFHDREVRDQFAKAASDLGFDLVARKPAPDTIPAVTETAGFDGRDSTAKPAEVIEDFQWSR